MSKWWTFWPFNRRNKVLGQILQQHLGTSDPKAIMVLERSFPLRLRPDVQKAIEQVVTRETQVVDFYSLEISRHYYDLVRLSEIFVTTDEDTSLRIAPPQYQSLYVGGERGTEKVLHNGLWLLKKDQQAFALLAVPSFFQSPRASLSLQLGCRDKPETRAIAEKLLAEIQREFEVAGTYRGKVLSLEDEEDFSKEMQTLTVHDVPRVRREEVILPEATLATLERNVLSFVRQRKNLKRRGLHVKKGLLFYGPPGTGKTHTIRYLISELQDQTVFLIRAEQMGLLNEYMVLARLLQPSVVVIEDVDLIASQRTDEGPNLPLLNRLLDEMDGIGEDAEILFILTTNRPLSLEEALAGRPGRIDQAIEFPLPDTECRRRLISLFAKEIPLPETLRDELAQRTEGVSAAFLKELIRRAWQVHLECGQGEELTWQDVQTAFDEMTVRGGKLNLRLLGAERFGFQQ